MMLAGMYAPARYMFEQAETFRPRRLENLHDLGVCSVIVARQKFDEMNHAAAMRELDKAIAYYSRAIEVHPGHQAAIEGKNVALKLKGQFEEALRHVEWVAKFVGPSARQYVFLARELEERGDMDGALLAYRQAVAVEPNNPEGHVAFAKFLLTCKDDEAAVYHLRMAYYLDPSNAWVIDQLASRGAVPPPASRETPGR
jgi:tetratricopeptide (TPR) repeat protein